MEDGAKRREINFVLLLITNIVYMKKGQAFMINLNIFEGVLKNIYGSLRSSLTFAVLH